MWHKLFDIWHILNLKWVSSYFQYALESTCHNFKLSTNVKLFSRQQKAQFWIFYSYICILIFIWKSGKTITMIDKSWFTTNSEWLSSKRLWTKTVTVIPPPYLISNFLSVSIFIFGKFSSYCDRFNFLPVSCFYFTVSFSTKNFLSPSSSLSTCYQFTQSVKFWLLTTLRL